MGRLRMWSMWCNSGTELSGVVQNGNMSLHSHSEQTQTQTQTMCNTKFKYERSS